MIRLAMQAGKRRKAEQGGYAGFGSPGYGFKAEGRELPANPDEADALDRIRVLHAADRSLREIAATLAEEGPRGREHRAEA